MPDAKPAGRNSWTRDFKLKALSMMEATDNVRALAEQLGFAPVKLGGLAQGALLIQAWGKTWAPLIFQDFFKQEDKNV